MKGICKICGCTENHACVHPEFGACFWITPEQDLCSHCVELKDDPRVIRPLPRALSWRQPFASLMLPPFNKIETRTWPTKYRGPVLICASQKAYPFNVVRDICGPEQFDRILDIIEQKEYYLGHSEGQAIAIGILVDCRPMTKADADKCFVQYHEPWIEERINKKTGKKKSIEVKLWCHVYEDVTPIKPFSWKGSQGWKQLTEEQIKKIEVL